MIAVTILYGNRDLAVITGIIVAAAVHGGVICGSVG